MIVFVLNRKFQPIKPSLLENGASDEFQFNIEHGQYLHLVQMLSLVPGEKELAPGESLVLVGNTNPY